MQQFREVSRTRTIYGTESHTSDFRKALNIDAVSVPVYTPYGEK